MTEIPIIGAGLAGLSAAAALGSLGLPVCVYETRAFPGGRATSWSVQPDTEPIDNCQHILLRCCVNLLAFYERLGVAHEIDFHQRFYFMEPGGRTSTLERSALPAPLHFAPAFLRAQWLSFGEKLALSRAILALLRQRHRKDLDQITMLSWLQQHGQPPRLIERFWRQILVSAINEELDRMAASHGFQVMWLGFLCSRHSYEMGISRVPLGELYHAELWQKFPTVRFAWRTKITRVVTQNQKVHALETATGQIPAEHCISAVPFERAAELLPDAELNLQAFEHSPITGVHLWFAESVTALPHGTLLERNVQWFYNKDNGRYLQLVISASRSMMKMDRAAIVELCLQELAEFLPQVSTTKLVRSEVIKEAHATISAQPHLTPLRPEPRTKIKGLYLAGDWTRTGWPSTMEGATRSGHQAADALLTDLQQPKQFLLPDIA
jgi:squalene-associated FAD-dependent desaturase